MKTAGDPLGTMVGPVIFTPLPLGNTVENDMGILRRIDRRSEPRTRADFLVTVWGVDTQGDNFLQEARVRDISLSGALISGIDADLRCGDVIGLLYLGRKARYRIVWLRYDDGGDKIQAAIHRMEPDVCPWQELLKTEAATAEETPVAELPPEWT